MEGPFELRPLPGRWGTGPAGRRGAPFLEILFIGTLEPFPGGSGTINAQVVRGLQRHGHRIIAVSPVGPLAGNSTYVPVSAGDRLRFPGISVRRYDVPFAEVEPHKTDEHFITLEREAIRAALRVDAPPVADVVLVGRETFMRYVPDTLPWPERPPVVAIGHSSNAHGVLTGDRQPAAAEDLLARLSTCQRIVLVSEHQRSAWQALGVPITVIPNAVDLEGFAPGLATRRIATQDDIVVIHASNLKDAKRPLDLVEAASRALERQPRLFFLIAGDGPLGEPMREGAIQAGIGDRFAFVGWQTRAQMPELFQQADMAVLMSSRESMACALLEAMACARTPIATDIPASRELLREGETGFMYPVGDVERLAAILVELAADAPLRDRVGNAARAAVEQRGVEASTDRYELVLKAVVEEAGRVRRRSVS